MRPHPHPHPRPPLRAALASGACAAALASVVAASPAAADGTVPADRTVSADGTAAGRLQPTCAVADRPAFPIETSIVPGTRAYHPGDAFSYWSVKLTNVSADTCRTIHPILILLDRERELSAAQPEFAFRAPDGDWHPVEFEKTAAGEHVGVFDDGFGGFALPSGDSATVPVRLRFADGTDPNRVTASLAVVQRQQDDGEWVGESEDYVFAIGEKSGSDTPEGVEAALEELAETGRRRDEALLRLGVAAGAFLLGGGALVVGSRRRTRRR